MAQNVIINEVTYQSVPQVKIPKSAGGTAVFHDTTAANVAAGDVRSGKTFFGASGQDTGTLAEVSCSSTTITAKGTSISIPAGIHAGNQTVSISADDQSRIISANIKKGVRILGVDGGLSAATVSQDGSTKALSIS